MFSELAESPQEHQEIASSWAERKQPRNGKCRKHCAPFWCVRLRPCRQWFAGGSDGPRFLHLERGRGAVLWTLVSGCETWDSESTSPSSSRTRSTLMCCRS